MTAPVVEKSPMEGVMKSMYAAKRQAPWDIGTAQPGIAAAEAHGLIKGKVLDVGCGRGDNSIYLATKGYQVTGVDASADAVQQARTRVQRQPHASNIVFHTADAFKLSETLGHQRFDTVIDSAMCHCFARASHGAYAASLHTQLKGGGQLVFLNWADWYGSIPRDFLPVRFSQQDIHTVFSPASGWRVESISQVTYQLVGGGGMDAYLAVITRL